MEFSTDSDYSLCKPHVQTCGGVRARTPITAYWGTITGSSAPRCYGYKTPQITKNLTELAATTSPHNHHLSSLHPYDHPCELLKNREEVVGGSTSSPSRHNIRRHSDDHMAKDREVILGWAFLKKHSGGIQSEIIAPVESSLSDYVFETDFLLMSDYSLCKPLSKPARKPVGRWTSRACHIMWSPDQLEGLKIWN